MNTQTAGTTATAELPTIACTCVIRAQDFNRDTTDRNRHLWHAGTMRHVIAALDGAPVAITVDSQTGHTMVGVRLVGLRSEGRNVLVEYRTGPGPADVQRTSFPLFSVGDTITPLDSAGTATGPKWIATRSYADECSAAIRTAHETHGEAEGRGWGKWTAWCGLRGVTVRYEPQRGNPANADRCGTPWIGTIHTPES